MPHEFIVEYYAKDIRTAPRATDIIQLYEVEILERVRAGYFLDIGLGKPDPVDEQDVDIEGEEQAQDTSKSPYTFLEQYTTYDLDGDGYPDPYIITIHKASSKIVRIVPNFLADSIEYNDKGEVSRITPESHVVKYGFMRSFDNSFYDTGFGEMMLHLVEAQNSITNQLLDAATLSNLKGGFIGKGLKIRGGEIKLAPGEWKMIQTKGADIRENMVPIQMAEPSMTMYNLLMFLVKMGEDFTADAMLQGNMNQQAAATTMAMVEESAQDFVDIFTRIHASLKHELKNYQRLNELYLTDEKLQEVLNESDETVDSLFNTNNYDFVPTSDPNIALNTLRLARANYLQQFIGNPIVNQQMIVEQMLRAANIEDAEDYIVHPQPQQPTVQEQALLISAENERERLQIDKADQMRKGAETQADIQETLADTNHKLVSIDKLKADTLKSTAEAIEKMKSSQTTIEQIEEVDDRAERISGMEERPSNQGVL